VFVPKTGERMPGVNQMAGRILIYDVTEQFHGDVSPGWIITIAHRATPARTQSLKGSPVYSSEAEARTDIADLNLAAPTIKPVRSWRVSFAVATLVGAALAAC
jgi:hypothetical protein